MTSLFAIYLAKGCALDLPAYLRIRLGAALCVANSRFMPLESPTVARRCG